MSMSQITVLKLRQLKPCDYTDRMLNSLLEVEGFGERMFQFNVKIPTKLWKALLRRRNLVADGNSGYITNLTLGQARPESDITTTFFGDEIDLDFLNDCSPVRHDMPGAVYVTPVDAELFDRFDIRVLRCVVLFRSPTVINFNVVLTGIGDYVIEAIFDVSDFPLTGRPPGALVSYTINI